MKLKVKKRDNRVVDFDRSKIENAILKAFEEVDGKIGNYAKTKARNIADYIEGDGRDFSTELYKAYSNLGEYQTNRVLDETSFNGKLADYVSRAGFDDIDEWAKAERKKIALASEISDKQDELSAMYSELNSSEVLKAADETFTGGGK